MTQTHDRPLKLGILGGTGWLGSALGRAVLAQGLVAPQDLAVVNRSGPRDSYFGHDIHWPKDAQALVAASDVVVISVRPGDWPDLSFDASGRLVVSFMAGVPLADLASCGGRCLRALPNAGAETGRSYTPWVPGPKVTAEDRATVTPLLSSIGTCAPLTDEAHLDLLAAISGTGPAFPALMAEALEQIMCARGLPTEVARGAALNITQECPTLMDTTANAPSEVVTRFVEYAGMTAAALTTARKRGFAQALEAGIDAALERAKTL